MCGITGILDLNGATIDRSTIEAMVKMIKYRGPDQQGVRICEGVGLGAARLRIFDLSEAGDQPFVSDDGRYTLVFNGEIYNHREIRDSLGKIDWKSSCDTEVVLQAFIHHGPDCLKLFNGMFAFAIWDNVKNQLFCARDRLGIKPFYWARQGDRFFFGSEIKCLLRAGIEAKPNYEAFSDYYYRGYYDHTESTFFDGILQLQPGHCLTVGKGLWNMRAYWSLVDKSGLETASDEASFLEEFAQLIEDAVRLRLRSDRPVGLHLSGGVDSTLLASLMQKVTNTSMMSLFSYVYDEPAYDERPFTENIGKQLGCDVKFSTLRPDVAVELVPNTLWHEEQPFGGLITVAKHKLFSEFEPDGVTVVLGGHGGDEIAGGYVYLVGAFFLDLIAQHGMGKATDELNAFARQNNVSQKNLFRFVTRSLAAYLRGGVSADGNPLGFVDGLTDEFKAQNPCAFSSFDRPFQSHSLNHQYQELRFTKLPRVLRNCDRASSAVGREKRVPFLDHRVVERAFMTDTSMRMRDGQMRYFWRKVGDRVLNKELQETPKRAMVDPQREWFQNELKDWVNDVIRCRSFAERGIFSAPKVINQYEKYCKENKPANSVWIWQAVITEMWYQSFIDASFNS